MLKASELILLMVGIMNIQRKRVEWQMSPISMENIALYIPAGYEKFHFGNNTDIEVKSV